MNHLCTKWPVLQKLWVSKTFLSMRLTVYVFILTVFQGYALNGYAQVTKLNLNLENSTIREILLEIENISEFRFLYNSKMVNVGETVSVEFKELTIDKALTRLFKGTDIDYRIVDRQVVLFSKSESANESFGLQQQRTVSGTVTDNGGQPLPGVTVVIKGTTQGTVTGSNGKYELSGVPDDATLVFSFIGMRTKEAVIGDNPVINVSMEIESVGLEEVVAIGYGVKERRTLTSSVSSVDVNEAVKQPSSSIAQSLAGRSAGLNVNLESAQVGGAVELQIRGSATGRSPLIVIDGMPTSDFQGAQGGRFLTGNVDAVLSTLNPQDIESIDILKDASATSIYGSKAAGGVILITTKKGKAIENLEGSFDVNFSALTGIQNYYNVPEMFDAITYMTEFNKVQYEWWLYDSRSDIYSNIPKPGGWIAPEPYSVSYNEEDINKFRNGERKSTDWIKEITRQGIIHDYDFSVTGNHKNTRFYTSFSAFDQKGIIKNNNLSKYTGRINVEQNFGEMLTGGINVTYSQQNVDNVAIGGEGQQAESAGIFLGALTFMPTVPVYTDEGKFSLNDREPNVPNPVSHLAADNTTQIERFLNTAFLNYRITPEFSVRGQAGVDRNQSRLYAYIPTTHIYGASVGGRADRSERINTNYQLQLLLNYVKTFGDNRHSISSTLGTEYMKFNREGTSTTATGFPFDGIKWYNLNLGANRPVVGSFGGSSELISYFLRSSYSFDNRFFLTANFRIDGSSNFAPGDQYAFFPGISAGWDVSQESFMKNAWLSQLKLRAGYGETGNDKIDPAFTDWYAAGYNTMWGNTIISGVGIEGLGNPDLTWEKQTEVNAGIDFGFFKNRVNGSIDVFNRKISRILGNRNIGSWNPVSSVKYNLDAIKQTYGTELTLNSRNVKSADFSWESLVTFTYYRDRWLKRDPSYVLEINESPQQFFNELWYYKSDGLVPTGSDDPLNLIPGTVRILDVNSYLLDEEGNRVMDENNKPMYSGEPDGKIDAADLVKIGVNTPFTIGFNNSFQYKQFDFSVYAYGVFNQWMEDLVKTQMGAPGLSRLIGRGMNMETSALNRWTPENQDASEVSSLQGKASEFRALGGWGDYYLQDAWFIRLQNITLGYTVSKGRLKKLRLFGTVTNAFVFTPYTGMDPETDTYLGSYPPQRTISFGVQLGL